MSGFSGVVRISNISDFIELSQKCILPLQNEQPKSIQTEKRLVGIRSSAGKSAENHSASVPSTSSNEKRVKVSLNDCLACSGCVTTAETVLIGSQTVEQMVAGLASFELGVVAVSPQSVCSLAAKFEKSTSEMALIMARYFKSLGARFVIDISFARLLSRQLHYEEFCREFVHSSLTEQFGEKSRRRTIISGVCPGFVCYAEKTHGEKLIPLISRVRSPQAIVGRLVKDYLCSKIGISANQVFMVSVQPCFDKKLEASRSDFSLENEENQEVDCVLTPVELEPLLSQSISEHSTETTSNFEQFQQEDGWLHSLEYGILLGEKDEETSGGYANYIIQRLIKDYTAVKRWEKIANDFEVCRVDFEDASTQIRSFFIAKAYGFRNIQNVVHRLKKNKLELHFIEMMACPSGCHNGGGQLRAETGERRAKVSDRVRELYAGMGTSLLKEDEEWERIAEEWESREGTDQWRRMMIETNFRPVVKDILHHNVDNW